MGKIIRPTYPVELSIGLLLLIFALSFFLASQLFDIPWHNLAEGNNAYIGMFLIAVAVIVMVLIIWEEFLFPIQVKQSEEGAEFRNHRTKLKKQVLIYFTIPLIFTFVYMSYDVHIIRFAIWAFICNVAPIAGKLISGINNYNDFLTLTEDTIAYKNNALEGVFQVKDIKQLSLVKDERDVPYKLKLVIKDGEQVTIDLDEMELEAFYLSIDQYISEQYQSLLVEEAK